MSDDPIYAYDVGVRSFKVRWPAARGKYLVTKPATAPENVSIADMGDYCEALFSNVSPCMHEIYPVQEAGELPWGRGLCVWPLAPKEWIDRLPW